MVYTNVKITKGTQTFTFPDGMVNLVDTTINCDQEETVVPGSGPMGNVANDVNGTTKLITVTGELLDTGSSAVTGSGAPTIITKEQMKYWLEALGDGSQTAMIFESPYEYYSVQSAGSSTVESVTIPAVFVATKVYVKTLRFTQEKANASSIPFTMTLWVAGF